jgi:hypothetical protein
MEPTYRVDLEHEPTEAMIPWTARITRLSDGEYLKAVYGSTRNEAFESAQSWIKAKSTPPERGATVYMTEDGEIASGPALSREGTR